jgi:hypothetical protein
MRNLQVKVVTNAPTVETTGVEPVQQRTRKRITADTTLLVSPRQEQEESMHGLYYVGQWVVVAMAESEAKDQWTSTWWVSNRVTHQSHSGGGYVYYESARIAVEAARVAAENALGALTQTPHKLDPKTDD